MANHKSALKRIRQNAKRRMRNVHWKSTVKSAIKQVRQDVEEKNAEAAQSSLRKAIGLLQRAASRGVIHRNTANRKASRLSRMVNKVVAEG